MILRGRFDQACTPCPTGSRSSDILGAGGRERSEGPRELGVGLASPLAFQKWEERALELLGQEPETHVF